MQPLRKHATSSFTPRYAFLGVLLLISAVFQIRLTRDVIQGMRVDVPFFAMANASAEIEFVSPSAANAGLHAGDVLLAVNGRRYTGTSVLAEEITKARPGDKFIASVRSQQGEHAVVLGVSEGASSFAKKVFDVLINVIMPGICLALGFWAAAVRPRDRLAWILLFLLLGFSQLLSASKIESWGPGWREAGMVWHTGWASLWPVAMLLFGLFFPEPFPWWQNLGRWRRWLPWLISAPLFLNSAIVAVIAVLEMTDYAASWKVYRPYLVIAGPLRIYSYFVVGVGFFASISAKSGMAISPDARRRLWLLYWGATAAMSPLLVLTIVAWIRQKSMYEAFPGWVAAITFLMLPIFPLTLAYVIVVQRAMDVRVVIRQGLQYGLAKTGIRVLQYVAIAVVIGTAFALGSNTNQLGKMLVIAIAVTAMFSIPRFAERLRQWTDRRFFREAYNAEQVLNELSDHVRSMVEIRPLIETVAARISETLHVTQIAVLLADAGPYRPAFALGYGSAPEVAFPADQGTAKVLVKHKEPARVYFDDPDSWLYRDPDVSEEDRAKLAELHSELLLPLSARENLFGFISLGSKRSEEPYSGADVRLLKSVATQAGLALENARLMSAIADEVAQRERLNREVEIAREVQERLFPQTLPPIAGMEYAGSCRPALGVGGDYYDFLALPGGQLGIAIGDVSGKGIGAALMMASLQASLRGEATRAPENLAGLISNVNRLVFEASSANRYATFFYGQYNPATRTLTYVNAGHNPPMLFHRSGGSWQITRLETGGTVVGLLESFPYQQAAVRVEPGDIFVAFTDGISEAMNPADEEWGEKPLIETVGRSADLTPPQIIAAVMQAADTFAAGAKQHDDMTLVVLHSQSSNEPVTSAQPL